MIHYNNNGNHDDDDDDDDDNGNDDTHLTIQTLFAVQTRAVVPP